MKDLDFDELDRAVSSLLDANGKTEATPAQAPAAPVSPDNSSTEVTVTATTPPTSTAATPKKQLVERRPSGRFMDVMHASSDMKSRPKPAVSRQATTVTPPTEQPAEEETVPTPPAPVLAEEPAVEDQHTFPDPLDFHGFSMEDTGSPEPAETTADEPEGDDHALALEAAASELNGINGLIASDEAPVSVETPFIDGSTIEKRPLGAFSVDASDVDASLLSEPTDSTDTAIDEPTAEVSEPEEPTQDDAEAVDGADEALLEREAQTPLDVDIIPEELKGEVVAVESSEVDTSTGPSLAGSIQQQYVEKSQPVADEPTPVFDTTQYHQPLKHTPKQKSGWTGVVLIILFIVAGIAGGAAVYFFDPFGLR